MTEIFYQDGVDGRWQINDLPSAAASLGRIVIPSRRAIRAERIEAKVAWFRGDSDEVSGSPRILADLRGEQAPPRRIDDRLPTIRRRGQSDGRQDTTEQPAGETCSSTDQPTVLFLDRAKVRSHLRPYPQK